MPGRADSYESHPWFKKYSKEWLSGSIRFDCSPAERSVFDDFLCLGNESRTRGVIQANDETPYPHSYLASMLNIPLELLESCIKKFTEQDRIRENKTGIVVLNFDYWQGLNTRRRGRPSKASQNRIQELSPEDVAEGNRQNRIQVGIRKWKKEHGRDLAPEEVEEMTDELEQLGKEG